MGGLSSIEQKILASDSIMSYTFGMMKPMNNIDLLRWYAEAGVDETIATQPSNRFTKTVRNVADIQPTHNPTPETLREPESRFEMPPKKEPMARSTAPIPPIALSVQTPSKAIAEARTLAESCHTLDELREAVTKFNGCLLKRTARKTVFADGNESAKVMVIGEAPGEQEDEQGIPFCGKSGQLLDNTLASIGLKRSENIYISNTIFWRPPGNRTPSPEEVAICAPFVKKHVALKNPDLLILAGGVAGSVLGSTESVSKLRRKFHSYTNEYLTKEIPAVVIYHPSYLLRQPGQKAAAWQDMLMIQEHLAKMKA
jgi:DNA polymerase